MGEIYCTITEKGTKTKESISERLGKIDAEKCTLQEAMAKIEKEKEGLKPIIEMDYDDV